MNFVSDEKVGPPRSIFHILFRFIWDLKIARNLFLPAFLFSLISSFIPQVFLWKLSRYISPGDSPKERFFENLSFHFGNALSPIQFLFALVGWTFLFKILSLAGMEIGGIWSTQYLHQKLIVGLARTRTTFFDENPSGRIINRVIGDYASIRNQGIMFLADGQYAIAELLCVAVTVALANPLPALFILPVLCIYLWFQSQMAPMMGHTRALKSILQGELLHRESDLIYGHTTYSFYKKQQYIISSIEKTYRKILELEMFQSRLSSWGYFWMGFASVTFSATVFLSLIISLQNHSLGVSLAAVILSALFTLENSLTWVALTMTNMTGASASVQRAYEYVDLPAEDTEEGLPLHFESAIIDPLVGDIEFIDYSMSYRPHQDRVLNSVSMKIIKGQHVGIIGRTGSGKSSWLQALLRMVYVQDGDIQIAGQSIFKFNITVYRKLFGVVPQDPYLLPGSVRFNLVGQNEKNLDEFLNGIFQKLRLNFGLDTEVQEGVSNLSLGEKQIICILRAIIQEKKIILMDEPTGSLDPQTASQIQRLIDEHLKERTLIIIAHRTEALKDFDQVFYFDSGRLIHSGTPAEILPMVK